VGVDRLRALLRRHPRIGLDTSVFLEQRADEFYWLLSSYPNLEWVPPDLEIAAPAARLRAQQQLRTPDALQAATAAHAGATAFLTNDAAFERVALFETLALNRLLDR
jgi:predicted nucleic acid-binding protein